MAFSLSLISVWCAVLLYSTAKTEKNIKIAAYYLQYYKNSKLLFAISVSKYIQYCDLLRL